MSVLGGEVLFEQLGLLPHDGLGLAFGHTGAHQLVDRRMCDQESMVSWLNSGSVFSARALRFPCPVYGRRMIRVQVYHQDHSTI